MDGGSANVLEPSITMKVADVSSEIGMLLTVVCCPGVIALAAPFTKIAERDGSITIGPMPGKFVVRVCSGLETFVVIGGSTGDVGSVFGGGSGTLDDLCTVPPDVGFATPGDVFWGNAGVGSSSESSVLFG